MNGISSLVTPFSNVPVPPIIMLGHAERTGISISSVNDFPSHSVKILRTALLLPPSAFACVVKLAFEPAEIAISLNDSFNIKPSGINVTFTFLFCELVLKTDTGITKKSPGAANLGKLVSVTISRAISIFCSALPKLLPEAATTKSLPRPLNSGMSSSVLISPFLSGYKTPSNNERILNL